MPSLASAASEAVDSATLAFLLSQTLAAKEREEQEKREEEARELQAEWRRRRRKVKDEFMTLLDLSSRSPLQQKRMEELVDMVDAMVASRPGPSSTSSSALKKKKRRKRMRTSSFPGMTSWCLVVGLGVGGLASPHTMLGAIPGFWAVAFAGLVLLVAPRPVFFPVVVYRPEMLCIMSDMDQKDSFALFSGSCMFKVGFTGDSAPHAVFFPPVVRPDARHHGRYGPEGHLCSEVVAVLASDYGSGMFLLVLLEDAVRAVITSLSAGPPPGGQLGGMAGFAGDDAFCAMFLFFLRPRCIHLGRYGPEGQLHGASLLWCSGLFPWSSLQKTIEILLFLLNTVVDVPVAQTMQVPLYLAVTCTVFGVRLGVPDYGFSLEILREICMYSALSSSTVDTCRCFSGADVENTAELPQLLR